MTKLEEYKRNKKIMELKLPKIYIVHSTPEGVDEPIEKQVIEIIENDCKLLSSQEPTPIDKYVIDNDKFPFESYIVRGEISNSEDGFGTGFGDLWCWRYYTTLSKDDADKYYIEEQTRINEKYKKYKK